MCLFYLGGSQMEKTIKIGDKTYKMASSAYTQFKYKNDTGRSLLADLSEFQNRYAILLDEKNAEENIVEFMNKFEEVLDIILRIAFIMTNECDKNQAQTYEDFLKQTNNYLESLDWLNEVVELATAPFRRGIQAD